MGLKTPAAVVAWWLTLRRPSAEGAPALYERLRSACDRWSCEEALAGNSLDISHWSDAIFGYAQELLKSGQKDQAVALLRHILTSNAGYLPAQMLFADAAADRAAAKVSAQIVYASAEDPDLRGRAAKFLGEKPLRAEDIPLLAHGETGLQVILIPLPSCDVSLANDAGRLCQKILGIPVKLRRLAIAPDFGPFDRVWRQRAAEAAILEAQGAQVDFTGWTRERFVAALTEAAKARDALYRFQMKAFIDEINQRPGQFDASHCGGKWYPAIADYRSSDKLTCYVGVMGDGLFIGDTNYAFSAGWFGPEGKAVLLSYQNMLANEAGDASPSRQRVVQRLAKEMVPATLGQLGVPRPVDPTDPYSSSSGVQATDAKSTTLSQPTLDALAQLKRR
jgi:hypothetical protein